MLLILKKWNRPISKNDFLGTMHKKIEKVKNTSFSYLSKVSSRGEKVPFFHFDKDFLWYWEILKQTKKWMSNTRTKIWTSIHKNKFFLFHPFTLYVFATFLFFILFFICLSFNFYHRKCPGHEKFPTIFTKEILAQIWNVMIHFPFPRQTLLCQFYILLKELLFTFWSFWWEYV